MADIYGADEGEARDILSKLKTSRTNLEGCRDELNTIKNNVNSAYEGKGATTFETTANSLNEGVDAIIDAFKSIEKILEDFVEDTVDMDKTNSSNFELQ